MNELYVRDVPRDIKDRFKAWCCLRGDTMTDVLVKFMADVGTGTKALSELTIKAPRKSPRKGTIFIRSVPVKTKANFKAVCEAAEVDMTKVIIAYMKKCIATEVHVEIRRRAKTA